LQQVQKYVKDLIHNKKVSRNNIISTIIDIELENISYLIESIFKLRFRKLLNLILNGQAIQKNLLCVEELETFTALKNSLNYYIEFLNCVKKGEPLYKTLDAPLNKDYLTIRFLKEVPKIIGHDLKEYGPFKIDDIAVLPRDHVITLIEHRAAIVIKIH